MATKLGIFNTALGHLGERKISSLSEAREPRRVLDDFYDGTVAYALERGFWNWAMRSISLLSSDSYDPPFGQQYAFEKPTDWVRTYTIAANENLTPPLLDVIDEGGLWYANSDPLYIKYVSNDTTWGMDLSLWSQSFADYVAARLANRACKRITGNAPSEDLLREEKRSLAIAKSRDAMDEPPGFPPTGTWATSRRLSGLRDQRRYSGN